MYPYVNLWGVAHKAYLGCLSHSLSDSKRTAFYYNLGDVNCL